MKNESSDAQSDDNSVVSFEPLNENLAKVTTMRNGVKFEIEMFVLTSENVNRILKIKEQISERLAIPVK
jgi:hypothetical protein